MYGADISIKTTVTPIGMHQFCQKNYWNDRNAKAKSKMLA